MATLDTAFTGRPWDIKENCIMTTRYSPSTGRFYPLDNDFGDDLPADVIEVLQDDTGIATNSLANIRYSPKTGCFYPLDIDYGSNLPDDVVEVSQDDHENAMNRPVDYTFDFVDGQLVITPPLAPTLDRLKNDKFAELSAEFSRRMGVIKSGYPDEEIESWAKQETEARSLPAPSPLLSAMAAARGITLSDLAARVIANADAWAAISGGLIGKRQAYEDIVTGITDSVTGPAAIAAVTWID